MDPALIATESKAGTEIIAPPAVVKTVTTASPLSNGEKKTWGAWTIEAVPMYKSHGAAPRPAKPLSR